MWFVLLGIAVLVVLVGGLYVRNRLSRALGVLGASARVRRWVGRVVAWLLFGVPSITFVTIVISLLLGRESISTGFSFSLIDWLLIYPFWMAMLTMLQALPFLLLIDAVRFVATRRGNWQDRLSRPLAIASIAVLALFAIYTPTRIVLERGTLEVNHYQVGERTAELKPLRIAFVADLQLDKQTDGPLAEAFVESVNHAEPDLVLSGGDWINTGPGYIEAAGVVAGQLKSKLGVFSVRGDHEHFAYRDQDRSAREVTESLARAGVEMIDNDVRFIDHQGSRIGIVYLSYNYIFRTTPADIRALLTEVESADYSILVTHQFDDGLAKLVRDRVDLALIAHTHGGQVNPFVLVGHVSIARAETPYVAGRYQLGATTLIVTSGIGFSIAPFRYAAPASIEIIDLYPRSAR